MPAQVAAAAGFAEADHKRPALVDSARVLQSLHEVVATVWLSLEDSATSSRQRLQRPLARWRRHIAGIFVDAYLNAAFENDVLRDGAARTSRQLIGRFAVFGAVTAVQDTWTETEQPFQTALETASSLLGDGWLDTQP